MNRTRKRGEEQPVTIPAGSRELHGILTVPTDAKGIVLFAHGSGSSRFSSRNQYVARELQETSLATLLFVLLDEAEAAHREKVFDIEVLAGRLRPAAAWVRQRAELRTLNLGYFGA